MKRRIIAALGIFTLMLSLVSTAASTASATETVECESTSKTFTTQVANRVDSGLFGDWARDTFTRTTVATDNCNGTYTLNITDGGHFTTIGGAKSPGADTALAPSFTGDLVGGASMKVVSSTEPHAPTGGTDGSVSTSDWAKLMFDGEFTVEILDWSWTYTYCGETWVNAAKGNIGNVTGMPCASPPKIILHVKGIDCIKKIPASAALSVKVQGVPHKPVSVAYSATDGQHGSIDVGIAESHGEEALSFAEDAGNGQVTVTLGADHFAKKVKVKTDCKPPVTSTTNTQPPTSPGTTTAGPVITPPSTRSSALPVQQANVDRSSGDLAYTGASNIGLLAGLGLLLLFAGGMALIVVRRLRRRPTGS